MRRILILAGVTLTAVLAATLLLVGVAAAGPQFQIAVTGVEPSSLSSQVGGTLSIYGSGFTTGTVARLVGYGLLETTYVNGTALTAEVPAGIPQGTYDLEVSDGITSATRSAALTIVVATPTPGPTPVPTAVPPPPPGRPVLTIRNYTVEPARPVVGGEFVVTIEIYNTGSRAGENTMVTFPGSTFLPVGDSGHLLWQLHINHTAVVTQRLRVPNGLASGSYNLRVNLSANDWEGNHYEYPETVGVEVTGVGQGRPQLVIESASTEPPVLGPGDGFSLTLRLANRGSRTATQVVVGAASADVAVPAQGSNVVVVDRVGIDQAVTATLPLVLNEAAPAGRLSLDVALDCADYSGGSYSARQSVGLEARTGLADRPQLIVAAYHTTPDPLAAGDTFTLTLEVSNVGGGDAQRLTLTLGGEGGSGMEPFAPLRSSNVKFVPRLAAGETVAVVQQLVVDGGAEAGAYSLPVALAFDDDRGTRHTDSQLISLLVRRRPHLQIGFYRPIGVVAVGVPFDLPVEVTNIGRTLVNASTMEVTSEMLEISDGSIYLGPLDGGTSGSLEPSAVARQGGVAEVVVTVHYLDDFDTAQVVTETLTVEIEEPPEAEPGEERAPDEGAGGIWDTVLRFLRGMLGLGS